jgi:hypothetical protein
MLEMGGKDEGKSTAVAEAVDEAVSGSGRSNQSGWDGWLLVGLHQDVMWLAAVVEICRRSM